MIIDFRVRAPFGGYKGSNLFSDPDRIDAAIQARMGARLSRAAREFSLPLLLEEAREAGIDRLVVPCRRGLGDHNAELETLVRQHPEILIGMAGIDVSDMAKAIEEIRRYVLDGALTGIILEPGQDPTPWLANSTWAFPLYQFCEENAVPIAFTFGGVMTRSLRYYDPLIIDDIAGAFPGLKIALCHGGWPYVTEVCQIVLNRGNVWLAPDFYMVNAPGDQDYVKATRFTARGKLMFASAWPLMPLKESRQYYENSGILPEVLPGVMGDNAAKFLGLA